MAKTPWMTSADLIQAVKRKIAIPINQETFTEEDILDFLNEEMMISQVPSMLQYHEEYFVYAVDVPLVSNKFRYEIPDRAIGMRMRELNYVDGNGNLLEMTRIQFDDKDIYQRSLITSTVPYAFYIEGNEIVLTPNQTLNSDAKLRFYIFLRPNQLVANSKAAIISSIKKEFTIVDNSLIQDQESSITINNITFVPVTGSPTNFSEFQIGIDANTTAMNFAATVAGSSLSNYITITNVANVITITSTDKVINLSLSDATPCYSSPSTQEFVSSSNIPSNLSIGSLVDFLQTKPGHRTRRYDIKVSSTTLNSLIFQDSDVPSSFIIGDYICSANECIIPQIPPDLHNGLAERACARILAAQGDEAGLNIANQKLSEIEQRQGTLIDNRSEGNPQRITARHSPLRYGRIGKNRGPFF